MNVKKIFITLVLLGLSPAAWGADKNDYYPLTTGSQWIYQIADYENKNDSFDQTATIEPAETYDKVTCSILKQKDKRGIVRAFVLKNSQGIFWKKISASKSFTPEASSVFIPELPIMMFPLNPGSAWDWEGKLKIAWINKNIKMRGEIVSTNEELIVPAGTFKCVKIYLHQIRDNEPSDEYAWYAPGVGQIKYQTRKTLKVLKSYNVK
ncbi:MAG: hypothetical protein HY920_07440 [Elusimicrobia bacterium]|nr:hypothetical protein [Elusimicrobiota bacterium]